MIDELVLQGDRPRYEISRAVARRELTRLARGVYTTAADGEQFVARNWLKISGRLLPGSVITDRSALNGGIVAGRLYLSSPDRADEIVLPGLTIEARKGLGPIDGDIPLPCGLYMASKARQMVENQRPTRSTKARPRATLTGVEFDDWLDHLARAEGEERLNRHRDQVRRIANYFDSAHAGDIVIERIGAALGSRLVQSWSRVLRARQSGSAYDQDRAQRFDALAAQLRRTPPQTNPIDPRNPERQRFAPFFDAYFSNFVEGTEFAIAEAVGIVFDHVVPARRTADAHDVTATHAILADIQSTPSRPTDFGAFVERLLEWHSSLMAARPDRRPGLFKTVANQAGATRFVDPPLVEGTLREGWKRIDDLISPFDRAVMTMFVVAEVHPFDDGNGRMARVMMNAELEAGNETRIIIPTVYRGNYLGALRRLSRDDDPAPTVKMLTYAHDVFAEIDFSDLNSAIEQLLAINAFEFDHDGARLLMPDTHR